MTVINWHSPLTSLALFFCVPLRKNCLASSFLNYAKRIQNTKHANSLEVLPDEHLTWKYHFNEFLKKLSRSCGTRHYAPTINTNKSLQLNFSIFCNYGSTFWGLTYHSYLNPLLLLQKKILRPITFQPFSDPLSPIFFSLKC